MLTPAMALSCKSPEANLAVQTCSGPFAVSLPPWPRLRWRLWRRCCSPSWAAGRQKNCCVAARLCLLQAARLFLLWAGARPLC